MPLEQKNRYVHKKYTKLSVEQTIVPGRLHSELCAWGVKLDDVTTKNINFYMHHLFYQHRDSTTFYQIP